MDSPTTPAAEETLLFQCIVEKQGRVNRAYKRRTLRLVTTDFKTSTLTYYDDTTLKGTIDLDASCAVRCTETGGSQFTIGFSVTTPARVWHFAVETVPQRDEILEAFSKVLPWNFYAMQIAQKCEKQNKSPEEPVVQLPPAPTPNLIPPTRTDRLYSKREIMLALETIFPSDIARVIASLSRCAERKEVVPSNKGLNNYKIIVISIMGLPASGKTSLMTSFVDRMKTSRTDFESLIAIRKCWFRVNELVIKLMIRVCYENIFAPRGSDTILSEIRTADGCVICYSAKHEMDVKIETSDIRRAEGTWKKTMRQQMTAFAKLLSSARPLNFPIYVVGNEMEVSRRYGHARFLRETFEDIWARYYFSHPKVEFWPCFQGSPHSYIDESEDIFMSLVWDVLKWKLNVSL